MRKKSAVIAIAALVVAVPVLLWFVCGRDSRNERKDPPVTDLAFDALSGEEPAGVGFNLVFESDGFIVFCNTFGAWGYDLSKRHITFDVDFIRLFGEECQIQGSYDPYAVRIQSSADGKTIVVSCADRNASGDPETDRKAYYIDTAALTYHAGKYEPLERYFDQEGTQGYILPGVALVGSAYIRGDESWDLFSEYGTWNRVTGKVDH